MTWAIATSRFEVPTMDFGIVEVPDAVVTPFARGKLCTQQGPFRWIRGAVHNRQGDLVAASQRQWDGDNYAPIAADPDRVHVPRATRRLRGTWLYAGHWSTHFGHFLLETLPNLWPPPDVHAPALSGVLLHRPARGMAPHSADRRAHLERPALASWQRELLDLAGYGALELRIVRGRGVRVQKLLVPPRPVLLKRWAQRPAVELWQRVSDCVGRRGPHRRVYLSRTRFHAEEKGSGRVRVDQGWQDHLDATFASAGFVVVHAETLPVGEQIALVRGAEVVAGLSGSSLHLSAFADRGIRVLVVGDQKWRRRPAPAQTMLDTACGHLTAFVPNNDRRELARVLEGLDER